MSLLACFPPSGSGSGTPIRHDRRTYLSGAACAAASSPPSLNRTLPLSFPTRNTPTTTQSLRQQARYELSPVTPLDLIAAQSEESNAPT